MAFSLLSLRLPMASARGDIFVAPNGNDANPGTQAKPFTSLERAKAEVRRLRSQGGISKSGLNVWIRGGVYLRTNSLELTADDSGTNGSTIRWRAYGTEHPRLIGGVPLTGFKAVSNPDILARLDPAARSNVVELDLKLRGIDRFEGMQSRGFGRPTLPAHEELFFGGQPMRLARWPNEGESEKIAGFPTASGQGDEHGGAIGSLPGGFFYAGERPRRWKDTSDIWVHGYWAWDWANSYERVAELKMDQHFISTAPPHGLYGFRKGQRFHFLNILEELDQPSEWFLDRKTGILYFWKPPGTGSEETVLSVLSGPLIRITGGTNLIIQGLTLEESRGNGIEIVDGASTLVSDCLLRNLGDWGVTISGGTNHGVQGCDIFNTGDGGVSVTGGDRSTLTPGGHYVENCHFAGQGRWTKCYVPAVSLTGVGLRASHNLIHDHPHCAILFWGNDHRIEYNEIHHIALETGDVGAIYTGRDYTFRGNKIRYNYIHETGGVGMGSMGVYMDDCVSGTEVTGNVFYKVHWAMFIGGGRDHRVENNLFVDCDPAVRVDGRGLDASPVWREMVDRTMRQSLAAVPLELYRQRYPELKSLDTWYGAPGQPALAGKAFQGVPPEGNVISRNVCVGKWLEAGWQAKPESLDVRDNLVVTDLRQVGSSAEGFKISKDSPAWKLGFKPIPFDEIGLIDASHRKRPSGTAANR
jgi:Right handed beta helix region